MKSYNDLVRNVLENGEYKPNTRTGIGTISLFGAQLHYDLQKETPIVNSKKTNWEAAYIELLWYLKGTGDISFLQENGVKIWDSWVRPGTTQLGPVYGVQWRNWQKVKVVSHKDYLNHPEGGAACFDAKARIVEIDQVSNLLNSIKTNPTAR